MTSRQDFTDEEWTRIRRAPLVAGVAISLADPGGPIELAKETMATLRSATLPPRALHQHRCEGQDRHRSRPRHRVLEGPDQDQGNLRSPCAPEHDRPGRDLRVAQPPRPSLVIVKSGTATFYLAADRTCTPHVVPAGVRLC